MERNNYNYNKLVRINVAFTGPIPDTKLKQLTGQLVRISHTNRTKYKEKVLLVTIALISISCITFLTAAVVRSFGVRAVGITMTDVSEMLIVG